MEEREKNKTENNIASNTNGHNNDNNENEENIEELNKNTDEIANEIEEVLKEEIKENNTTENDNFDEKEINNDNVQLDEVGNSTNSENQSIEINSKINNNIEKNSSDNHHFSKYISYEKRIIIYVLVFVIFFVASLLLILKSVKFNGNEYITFEERSNLDYKVFLKKNSFYEEEYLDKGMLYVASLIDRINIDFVYNFNISKPVDFDFKYNITGVLSIMDSEGKKTYLTKTYDLLPDKTISLNGEQDYTIMESLIINYNKYNKIANSFKSTYGLDTSSKLSIYLNVDKTSDNKTIVDQNNLSNMLIDIPLSEKSVSISMDYQDINNNSTLIKKSSITVENIIYVVIAVILLIISFYGLFKIIKLLGILNPKKSKYDKYINKIIRQYDRLIVEVYTAPNLSKYNVIKIKEFDELLDMRDNLKIPIMYYIVAPHHKSYFYILNNKDLYLLVVKSVDMQ